MEDPSAGAIPGVHGLDEGALAGLGRRFFEASSDLLAIVDMEGSMVWANQSWKRVLGIDPDELLGDGFIRFIHPDDRDPSAEALAREIREGKVVSDFENRYRTRDDSYRVLLWSSTIDHEHGLIFAAARDVTEAREAEAELARSVSILKAALEATADGILVVDTDGNTESWNRNFAEMWRIPITVIEERDDEELLGFVLEQLRDADAFLDRVRELYAHPEQESFDVLEFKDGRVFERYSAPQLLDGEVVGRVWSFRDVTERLHSAREKLELEARLQQSQRLESLGRLAGGIAHDFNNHLVAILNYATLAGEELPEGAAGRADLDEVIRAAERASTLTRELVAFSRQEMIEPRPLLLNSLVAETERLLRRTIGEDVELRVDLGRDLPAVEADPSQLERVLVNLAVNARDAMPDGGVLEISTETIEVSGDGGREGLSGALVRLTVRDEGTGMSPDVAKRALEPFFTTKPSGEGTGLGLATVYGIVNQSGGRLAINSVPGRGTTMTIDLPASSKAPEPAPPRPEQPPVTVRGAVLVVEDEPPVRRLTARLLRDAGFRTMEAAEGNEALALLEGPDAEDLSLILTDIVMPRMSGRELAERAHEDRPDLPVLFMSGYTDDVVVRHGVATADLPFLAKPFTRETLLEAVTEALETGP